MWCEYAVCEANCVIEIRVKTQYFILAGLLHTIYNTRLLFTHITQSHSPQFHIHYIHTVVLILRAG